MHPGPVDSVHLIPIPVILWSQVSPILTGVSKETDPFEAIKQIENLQLNRRLEQCRSFVLGALTGAERRVVALLVEEGLSDREIGSRLSISSRTVEQHLRSAYQKAAAHWEMERVDRATLRGC
jgi:DNA-binding NarL/FixJ family response regulator